MDCVVSIDTNNSLLRFEGYVSWPTNSMRWYGMGMNNGIYQYNGNGTRYYYCALG